MTHDGRHLRIVTWDHREQPDWDEIHRAMHQVFNGSHFPSIVLVPDTGSDQYAVVVSSLPISPQAAQEYFQEHEFDEGES